MLHYFYVTGISDDDLYTNEFTEGYNGYNVRLFWNGVNDIKFTELISEWFKGGFVRINIVISATKYKLVSSKKDGQDFLLDGLTEKKRRGSLTLCSEVKQITNSS